jgi:hypothetical protein
MGRASTKGAVNMQYDARLADRIIIEIMITDIFVFRSIPFASTIQNFDTLG